MRASRKPPNKKGFLPKLKAFMEGLGDRYHRALLVIDEALASDNLKDKIWAVDLILKRTPSVETDSQPKQRKGHDILSTEAISQLSDTELVEQIRGYVKDWEP
jgi:hypothetical protein